MAITTKKASTFKERRLQLKEAAKRTANKASKASPCMASEVRSFWVADPIMEPLLSPITSATAKEPLTATSKLLAGTLRLVILMNHALLMCYILI